MKTLRERGALLVCFSRTHFLTLLITSLPLAFVAARVRGQQAAGAPNEAGNIVQEESQSKPRGKSVVRGRAVFDDDARPVRRARVVLIDPINRANARFGATDGRGAFEIKNVAAGRYYVMVDAPNAVSSTSYYDFGDEGSDQIAFERIKDRLTEIAVDGTASVTEVKARAERGGVITGKVRYADGDPAVGAHVSVSRKRGERISPYFIFRGGTVGALLTDDRGVYRVAGLPSGQYLVSAAEEEPEAGIDEERQVIHQQERPTLAATYHPSATAAAAAAAVNVTAGKETTEINITLVERRTHRLAGTVVARRDNQPLVHATVSISSAEEADNRLAHYFGRGQMTGTDQQGRWSFANVPAGTYVVSVETRLFGPEEPPSGATSPQGGVSRRSYVAKRQEVTISDADVTDLKIEVAEGARLSGMIAVEGGKPVPRGTVIAARQAESARQPLAAPQAMVHPDGKWTMSGVAAGEMQLEVRVFPENDYYVKAITAEGQDLLQVPLRVEEGADVSDINIVLSAEVATLTGRLLAKGSGVSGPRGVVALVPAAPEKRRTPDAYLLGNTNADGAFSIKAAPAEYLVFVLPQNTTAAFDEEYIRAHAANAQTVTLKAGEQKRLDLVAP